MADENINKKNRWIIIGLGNPGREYKNTRHNLGVEAIVHYAKAEGIQFSKRRKLYSLAEIKTETNEIFLLKTKTFVNESGIAVKRAVEALQGNIVPLIVCDDINLPFGKVRLRKRGNSGGHNGLKSISKEMFSNEYPRLRIGLGFKQTVDPVRFVLGKFETLELKEMPLIFNQIRELLNFLFMEGLDRTMNKFN